jgi:hypothetical protein
MNEKDQIEKDGNNLEKSSHFSERSFNGFVDTFNYRIERDFLHKIRASPHYSIIVDEAMDSSRTENLIIYFKYLDIEKGETLTSFSALLKLERMDSGHIFSRKFRST